MNSLNSLFNAFDRYLAGAGMASGVHLSGTIYQLTIGTESLIIGRDTLRFTYSDNVKNAMISFTPTKVAVGSFERPLELNLSCFESGLNESYSRLHVDGGELFQYSTVHDFDFSILPELYTKYLELLKAMKESPTVKGEKLLIDEAIQNLSDTVELYKKEA